MESLKASLERIKYRIDHQMNDLLCSTKPAYDDSLCGINDAYDLVRKIMLEEIERAGKIS